MRRWDGLVERYLEELQARGLAKATIDGRCRELEEVGADQVVQYLQGAAAFRSKADRAGVGRPPRDGHGNSYTIPCWISRRPVHTTGHATAGMPRSASICTASAAASSVSNRSEM